MPAASLDRGEPQQKNGPRDSEDEVGRRVSGTDLNVRSQQPIRHELHEFPGDGDRRDCHDHPCRRIPQRLAWSQASKPGNGLKNCEGARGAAKKVKQWVEAPAMTEDRSQHRMKRDNSKRSPDDGPDPSHTRHVHRHRRAIEPCIPCVAAAAHASEK